MLAGQTQKEYHINEAHALLDGLLHCAIEGVRSYPPFSPPEGQSYIVGAGAAGDWAGHDDELAMFQSGTWLYVEPSDGLVVFDKEAGQLARFDGGWKRSAAVAVPAGGEVADAEARAAIAGLIVALQEAGILPAA